MGKGSSSAWTGSYFDKIVDVHSHRDETLPPISHFQAFFARFGPILTVYHQGNSRISKKPHTYVVFKNEGAVTKVKEYLAQKKNQDFWTQSCTMVTGIKICPAGLINAIQSMANDVAGPSAGSSQADGSLSSGGLFTDLNKCVFDTSRAGDHNAAGAKEEQDGAGKPSSLKRTRRDQSSGADPSTEPNKRKRATFEEASSSTSEQDPVPPYTSPARPRRNADTNQEPSRDLVSIKRKLHIPSRLSVPYGPSASALELVQEVAELAAKSCSRNAKSSTPGGEAEALRAELERMKSKCNRVKSKRDQLRAQRDEAREEREQYRAEAETCRELRRQVEKLKKALKEKDENSDKILKLTIASLKSSRGLSSSRAGSDSET